ncbi:hypothetical protein HOY80DRAFT_993402 [Tuber brumale]|nr:hypothetical protein HOY80DRAFT_993402 [Tuber brumale]
MSRRLHLTHVVFLLMFLLGSDTVYVSSYRSVYMILLIHHIIIVNTVLSKCRCCVRYDTSV